MYKITLYMFICMGLLTGVLCDNYSYLGLVASSLVSGFLFVLILVMIVFGAIWNDWFPRFQHKLGKIKVERIIKKKHKKHESQESIIGSDLKHYSPSHGVSLPPSRQNTEGRRSELTKTKFVNTSMQPSEKADTWIQEVQPSSFEEKTKEMYFEDEEPFILVTELLPETEPFSFQTANGALPTVVSQHSDTKVETVHSSEQIVTGLEKQHLTVQNSGGVVTTVEKQPLQVQSSGGIVTTIEKQPIEIRNSGGVTTSIERKTVHVQNSGGIISMERQPLQVQSSGGIVTTIEKQPLQIQTTEQIVTTSFEKQPLQRLSTLPNSTEAVMDLSDEDDDAAGHTMRHDSAVFKRSVTGYGYADANMVLY